MNTKMFTIAALLAATLLTGFLSTPMAAYAGGDDDYNGGDISETNTEQRIIQENVGSGFATNFNCAQNLINSPNIVQECDDEEIIVPLLPPLPLP
jgi:hypothetical protein